MPNTPQDRKPKNKSPKPAEGITVTVRDIEIVIPAEALDDYELMEDMADAEALGESTDPADQNRAGMLAFRVLRRLLTPEATAAMKDAVRDPKTGRVPFSAMMPLLNEIMEAASPNS